VVAEVVTRRAPAGGQLGSSAPGRSGPWRARRRTYGVPGAGGTYLRDAAHEPLPELRYRATPTAVTAVTDPCGASKCAPSGAGVTPFLLEAGILGGRLGCLDHDQDGHLRGNSERSTWPLGRPISRGAMNAMLAGAIGTPERVDRSTIRGVLRHGLDRIYVRGRYRADGGQSSYVARHERSVAA
jgi:hypothetical protein